MSQELTSEISQKMSQDSSKKEMNPIKRAIIGNGIALGLTALILWALIPYSQKVGNWPLIEILAIIAFAVHWVAFVPAYIKQTEKFYDLTGSITYLTVIGSAVYLSGAQDPRALLVAFLVTIWTLRLGSFLFLRVLKDGKDTRFDEIKPNAPRFFTAWTLSGLWVFLTALAAIIVITSSETKPLGVFAYVGFAVWVIGFLIEVLADHQKRVFRKDPENKGKFIKTGLWAWSRHPNYFGEIVLWLGILIIAIPVLKGWQWLAVLSPIFVYVLLTRVSGIPMLEEIADERWGGQDDYEAYKANTPELFLKPPQK